MFLPVCALGRCGGGKGWPRGRRELLVGASHTLDIGRYTEETRLAGSFDGALISYNIGISFTINLINTK